MTGDSERQREAERQTARERQTERETAERSRWLARRGAAQRAHPGLVVPHTLRQWEVYGVLEAWAEAALFRFADHCPPGPETSVLDR